MNYYAAPMEGITGYVYRNAHYRFFGNGQIDRYYMPFLSPNMHHHFSSRELNDVLPEHNQGIPVIPQLLSNHAEDFLWAVSVLKDYGYAEVNLNLGCPSGTVVAKRKGSGFLAYPDELNRFLETIFTKADLKISIKTRIGRDDPEEWEDLIKIYNQYPLQELIVHPRIRTDFYKNKPNWEVFAQVFCASKAPVCYNGDLFTVTDMKNFVQAFPDVTSVMLGRGLIANPHLAQAMREQQPYDKAADIGQKKLKEFHDALLDGYTQVLSGGHNALYKMKELWTYMIFLYTDYEKYAKKIRKAQKLPEYQAAVERLFAEQEINPCAGYQKMRL